MDENNGSATPEKPQENPEIKEIVNLSIDADKLRLQPPFKEPSRTTTIDLEPVSAEWIEEQGANASKAPGVATPCSYFSCANGHGWPPEIGMAGCPGCKAPVVAIRFRNCPVCNEPAGRWTVRVDRTSPAMGVPAVCKGQQGTGETHFIEFSVVQEKDPESQQETK